MSYRDFSLASAKASLGLDIREIDNLFARVPSLAASDQLATTLAETTNLALAINTEKARSELIITPILLEIRQHFQNKISFFSGPNFNVEPNLVLTS